MKLIYVIHDGPVLTSWRRQCASLTSIKSRELMLSLFIVRIVRNTNVTCGQDAEFLVLKLAVRAVTTLLQRVEG